MDQLSSAVNEDHSAEPVLHARITFYKTEYRGHAKSSLKRGSVRVKYRQAKWPWKSVGFTVTRLNTGRDVAYSLKRKRTVDEIQRRDIPTLNPNRHSYEDFFKGKDGMQD